MDVQTEKIKTRNKTFLFHFLPSFLQSITNATSFKIFENQETQRQQSWIKQILNSIISWYILGFIFYFGLNAHKNKCLGWIGTLSMHLIRLIFVVELKLFSLRNAVKSFWYVAIKILLMDQFSSFPYIYHDFSWFCYILLLIFLIQFLSRLKNLELAALIIMKHSIPRRYWLFLLQL